MTASQYKNILQWSFFLNPKLKKASLEDCRKIFQNLGVSFPLGELQEIIEILKSKKFLGWTPCSCEDAQKFANIGVPTIALNSNHIIFISPDDEINNLSNLNQDEIENVKSINELSYSDIKNLLFFAYSYGYIF